MRFRGQIQGIHLFPQQNALMLSLTRIESTPEIGMFVRFLGRTHKIVELGRNSTDGKVVSHRSCLTGAPVSAYGSICIDWPEASVDKEEMFGEWVEEEAIQ